MATHRFTDRETLEWMWLAFLGLALLILPASLFRPSALESVTAGGKLTVLTINGPTSYYEGPQGLVGFEYDLANAFARHLGVELEMVPVHHFKDLLPSIASGKGDFAAAGITVTESRKSMVRFTDPYQEIRQQVVYRYGTERPNRIEDLIGRHLTIVSGTSFSERLNELSGQYPGLTWAETDKEGPEDLLIEVWDGLTETTIADSNLIAVVRQFYPELLVAFDIQQPEPLAWAFPLSDDNSLYQAANDFLKSIRDNGELDRMLDRYYGPANRYSFVDLTVFRRRIETVLPEYLTMFRRAAEQHSLDWRLLAAQAYQESLWDPNAVSPTGVRGIMQLTHGTARSLNVDDRVDPESSIIGGALYLRDLIDRIPPGVQEPDRTWMALAAYNVGLGHLEDARVITQRQGSDPNVWADVRERLPLLVQPVWYRQTRHGYARGYEPVEYVRRIRTYYDILVKYDQEQKASTRTDAISVQAPAL